MALTSGAPDSIQTSYRNMFRQGFEQSYQQFDSRLLSFVEMERQASEFDYYDRIGIADEMTEDTTRYGDNPMSEIEHDRRRIGLRDYELGKAIDEKDLIRVVSDPTNAYTRAMQASGYRKMDDVIFESIYGKSYAGKKGETEINWTGRQNYNNGQVIVGGRSAGHSNPITNTGSTAGTVRVAAGDYEGIVVGARWTGAAAAAADTGVTLAKLKAVRTTMLRLDAITQDTTLNCFLPAQGFEDLLGIDEVINSDYSVRKNLAEGNVTTFMGFRFIHAERIPKDTDGNYRVLVSLPRAIKLAVGVSLNADIWRLPGKKNIPYIYFKQSLGGSRMWGEVAAEIVCKA